MRWSFSREHLSVPPNETPKPNRNKRWAAFKRAWLPGRPTMDDRTQSYLTVSDRDRSQPIIIPLQANSIPFKAAPSQNLHVWPLLRWADWQLTSLQAIVPRHRFVVVTRNQRHYFYVWPNRSWQNPHYAWRLLRRHPTEVCYEAKDTI